MKLKNILLTGIISLSLLSCSTSKNFLREYGKRVILKRYGAIITACYDTDNDNYEDIRYYYQIEEIKENTLYMTLVGIQQDKNKNRIFEDDEFIWIKQENEEPSFIKISN
jgi:hypothetical protein